MGIPYNLACYAAQLGDLPGAREWLAKSFKVGDEVALKREALEDPDLESVNQGGGICRCDSFRSNPRKVSPPLYHSP